MEGGEGATDESSGETVPFTIDENVDKLNNPSMPA
jgi:hypothetical protein